MRKSLLIGFATLFVIVAASCFGYIGWQLWGTSYLSNKTQTETLNEITNQWNIPTEDNGDDTIEMATSEENEEPLLKNKNVKKFLKTVENDEKDDAVVNIDGETFRGIALLSVPQAGIRNLPVLKGSQDRILDKGVGGYYEGTARPGQLGNFAVAGHRVSYSGVFDHLDKLKPGDKIKVQTKKHTYFYKKFNHIDKA